MSGVSFGSAALVADVEDAVGHPGGVDDRVGFGPGADVPGQCHGVRAGVDGQVTVIRDQRVAVERVLDEEGDVSRVHERVEVEFCLDGFADVLGFPHFLASFPWRVGRQYCRSLPVHPVDRAMGKTSWLLWYWPPLWG